MIACGKVRTKQSTIKHVTVLPEDDNRPCPSNALSSPPSAFTASTYVIPLPSPGSFLASVRKDASKGPHVCECLLIAGRIDLDEMQESTV